MKSTCNTSAQVSSERNAVSGFPLTMLNVSWHALTFSHVALNSSENSDYVLNYFLALELTDNGAHILSSYVFKEFSFIQIILSISRREKGQHPIAIY